MAPTQPQVIETVPALREAVADHGVEIALVPRDDQVYRPAHATWVEVGSVAEPLEGAAFAVPPDVLARQPPQPGARRKQPNAPEKA